MFIETIKLAEFNKKGFVFRSPIEINKHLLAKININDAIWCTLY